MNRLLKYIKAQAGGKPVYVESKNDPRYKGYQDSLSLYNSYQDLKIKLKNNNYKNIGTPNLNESGLKTPTSEQTFIDFIKTGRGKDGILNKEKLSTEGLKRADPKKIGSLYSVKDFYNEQINEDLPPQLFSDKIKPKTKEAYEFDSFNPFSNHFKDRRLVYNYDNVKPKQQVLINEIKKPIIKTPYKTNKILIPNKEVRQIKRTLQPVENKYPINNIVTEILPLQKEIVNKSKDININGELKNEYNINPRSKNTVPFNRLNPSTNKEWTPQEYSDYIDAERIKNSKYNEDIRKGIIKQQTGGIAKDATNVSKKKINPIDVQRINNNNYANLIKNRETSLSAKTSDTNSLVKHIGLKTERDRIINKKQDILNSIALGISPFPVIGEVFGVGNSIAQGVTDAYQGEYTDAALSAIPYGVNKLNKYTKSISKSVFPSNYLSQEEAVIAKGERMLSQKSKFRDQSSEVSEYFRTAKDRHNPASDYPAEKLGVNKSISTEVSKNANLSDANKARIAAHEVGHYYRNSADEANEWSNLVDLKNTGKTGRYLQGKPIFKQEQETEIGNDILNLSKGTRVAEGNYNEIRERAGQLKDYIAQKNNIPLNQDFNITEKQFNNSLKNYVKDTGLDNNMTPFIKSIKDKKGFLNMMNKSALTTTGAIIANDKFKKQQGGSGNLVNAESKEVFRGEDGQIRKVNEQAPTHDEGILINEQGQTQPASYNNGGIVIPAESVLSATHENRDRGDKSYGELDEAIKIKSSELNDYALSLGLKKINHNKTVSPSKAFELLREGRDKEANKLLKFKTNTFSDDYSKASAQANETIANTLVKDEDLYDYLFQIQEIKKTIV